MLNELFPDAKNVGLVYCSAEANSQYQVDTVKAALEKLGYTCTYYAFSDSNDLSSVATTAATESDVIYGAYSIGILEISSPSTRTLRAILPVATPRS